MYQIAPARVLQINLLRLDPLENWGSEPFPDQPWIFEADLLVSPQVHSDSRTQTPNIYNGLDVSVNDYLTTQSGKALKITSISFQDEDQVTCILEDTDRSNSSIDTAMTGESAMQLGNGLLFTVNNGLPVLFPLPTELGSINDRALIDILGRFMYTSAPLTPSIGISSDVDLTNLSDGAILVFNAGTNMWETVAMTEHDLDGGEY